MESPVGYSQLSEEFNSFKLLVKDEIQTLKNQNNLLMSKLESSTDKIKSFKALKKEFRDFLSINGYSALLDTSSLLKKMFALVCIVALFTTCMILVDENYREFQANDVVTQIKVIENETMTFPAVTLCFQDLAASTDLKEISLTAHNISEILYECFFEDSSRKCSSDDFEHFSVNNFFTGSKYECHKFNGGKNGTNHAIPLLRSNKFGKYSGLTIIANLSRDAYLIYYVGDNFVNPTFV